MEQTNSNQNGSIESRRYSHKELNSATDFVSFLYELWIKSRKNEIMELDKTNHDNGEPSNNN